MSEDVKEDVLKERILKERDFVDAPEFDYSLSVMMASPNFKSPASDSVIKRVMHLTQDELDDILKSALKKLKNSNLKDYNDD